MTNGWYLVKVAITFNEFLTLTLGGTEVSTGMFTNPRQCLQPFPICCIFSTVLGYNRVCCLILLQLSKGYFCFKTSAFVTLGSNVLLDGEGNVKLADFGLSKMIQVLIMQCMLKLPTNAVSRFSMTPGSFATHSVILKRSSLCVVLCFSFLASAC